MVSVDIGSSDIDTGDAVAVGAVLGPAAIEASAKRVLDEMVDTGRITKSTYLLTRNLNSAVPVGHRTPRGLSHPCEPNG